MVLISEIISASTALRRFPRLLQRQFSLPVAKSKSMLAPKSDSSESGKSQTSLPSYIEPRLKEWERLKSEVNLPEERSISVILKNIEDQSISVPATTRQSPLDLIRKHAPKLSKEVVAVTVDGANLWDATRLLENDCSIEVHTFKDDKGREVCWHSSAHILGEAMEQMFGGDLCYGPTVDSGFYYDIYMPDQRTISSRELPEIEKLCEKMLKESQPFERLVLDKQQLLDLFRFNPFKQRIIREKIKDQKASVYRCGTLIDLCRGPHVPNSSLIGAIKIYKNSASYWEGDVNKEHLQRVYGISFSNRKQLREWTHFQEEAAKRNHKKIGLEQELYFFHELSPGSCFFYPKGAHIYNRLIDLIREQYRERGFTEVITPNIFNHKLWVQSGHWEHYADNMFSFESEGTTFALKPMNCPGHCLMFSSRLRSWRELPIRYADFGVLHRNELSGALTGLTRVRRFQQDDAHIFCSSNQLKSEIGSCLDFMRAIYAVFGFEFKLQLSTRPEKFLGEIETWNDAEEQLREALEESGDKWELNEGDGAFYGPKIDVQISDALKRWHQCATVQLDFQLPARFNLEFMTGEDADSRARPVIIHRAILGSVERMMAIVTEHFGGKWPLWLSPRQVAIVPVNNQVDSYALEVEAKLKSAGLMTECKLDASESLNKKIRNAQTEQFNFILVVGAKEKDSGTVNVRTRRNEVVGEMTVEAVIERVTELSRKRCLDAEKEFMETKK